MAVSPTQASRSVLRKLDCKRDATASTASRATEASPCASVFSTATMSSAGGRREGAAYCSASSTLAKNASLLTRTSAIRAMVFARMRRKHIRQRRVTPPSVFRHICRTASDGSRLTSVVHDASGRASYVRRRDSENRRHGKRSGLTLRDFLRASPSNPDSVWRAGRSLALRSVFPDQRLRHSGGRRRTSHRYRSACDARHHARGGFHLAALALTPRA